MESIGQYWYSFSMNRVAQQAQSCHNIRDRHNSLFRLKSMTEELADGSWKHQVTLQWKWIKDNAAAAGLLNDGQLRPPNINTVDCFSSLPEPWSHPSHLVVSIHVFGFLPWFFVLVCLPQWKYQGSTEHVELQCWALYPTYNHKSNFKEHDEYSETERISE